MSPLSPKEEAARHRGGKKIAAPLGKAPDPPPMLRETPISPQAFHILVALAERDQHGYGIMLDVAARTGGKLRLSPGTLYGSIKRLLEDGLIVELHEKQRPKLGGDLERRRYYRLTALGRKTAMREVARMSELLEQARAHGLIAKSH